MKLKTRCAWVGDDPLYIQYHDVEWGTPLYNDQKLFEFLILEGAQAGLSWITILRKRENYLKAFDNFDPQKVAHYRSRKIKMLLENKGLIRNQLKIRGVVQNAKAFLQVRKEFTSFSTYIWEFVKGKPKKNAWKTIDEVPSTSAESIAMAKDLKRRGFTFVGPTICYAFMQAVGMVNDHTVDCFRYQDLVSILK